MVEKLFRVKYTSSLSFDDFKEHALSMGLLVEPTESSNYCVISVLNGNSDEVDSRLKRSPFVEDIELYELTFKKGSKSIFKIPDYLPEDIA